MVRKVKCNRAKLEFSSRGLRKSPNSGLYYYSKCGGYALYKSDRLCGDEVKPIRWIAFSVTNGAYCTISRRFSRKSAERACEAFDKSLTG